MNGQPSERAVEAAMRSYSSGGHPVAFRHTTKLLAAAHDPALGLDRSVCLRDVVRWARARNERERDDMLPVEEYVGADDLVDEIEREFGG